MVGTWVATIAKAAQEAQAMNERMEAEVRATNEMTARQRMIAAMPRKQTNLLQLMKLPSVRLAGASKSTRTPGDSTSS